MDARFGGALRTSAKPTPARARRMTNGWPLPVRPPEDRKSRRCLYVVYDATFDVAAVLHERRCTNAIPLDVCRWQFVLHLLYTAFIRIRDLLASCWEP
jgi:hypothetical protein